MSRVTFSYITTGQELLAGGVGRDHAPSRDRLSSYWWGEWEGTTPQAGIAYQLPLQGPAAPLVSNYWYL